MARPPAARPCVPGIGNRPVGTPSRSGIREAADSATPEKPLQEAKPFPFHLTTGAVAAPGRNALPGHERKNLIVVTEEGKVYELGNSHA